MIFGNPIPILRIFDEAKAREFYVDFLGFRVNWEHRFAAGMPLYMQVVQNACVLHFSAHHGDCSPGAALRIDTKNLDQFQRQLLAKDYPHARPGIEATPWGTRDMAIQDPFGNRLIFSSAGGT